MMKSLRTREEIEQLTPMAKDFYAAGDLPGTIDTDMFVANWVNWINAGIGVVIGAVVDDRIVGGCGGLVAISPNDGELEAQEMFWYLAEEHRSSGLGLKCLEAWEQVCRARGAQRISMARLCNPLGEKIGKWLESKGYKPVEVRYYKDQED